MAEGDAPRKKLKLDQSYLPLLEKALNTLETNVEFCLGLLKVTNACAGTQVAFNKCPVEIDRSFDFDLRTGRDFGRVYTLPSLFTKGKTFLKQIIAKELDWSNCESKFKIAYERLKDVLLNEQEIVQHIRRIQDPSETEWTVILVHHLLKKLAVYQTYVIDYKSKDKQKFESHEKVKCPCCSEVDESGSFGDCSIGDERVFHGSLDVLLGFVALASKVALSGDETAFEIKKSNPTHDDRAQIVGEAIVFSFLQAKQNEGLDNVLIPTIAISNKEVVIIMYDSQNDILCESSTMPLMSFHRDKGIDKCKLHPCTLLALWFVINYPIFSSGITQKIKDRAFTSDFLLQTSEEIKNIYKTEVRFGNVRPSYEEKKFQKFDSVFLEIDQ